MEKLSGEYIAGFVDGEGCFALKFRRDVKHDRKNKPAYFYWDAEFAINLKADDREILERIAHTLECGRVGNKNKAGTVRYSVNNTDDLVHKITVFFQKHKLQAKKRFDFELWEEAVRLLHKNRGRRTNLSEVANTARGQGVAWDQKELKRLEELHEEMKKYKGGNRGDWKWL